MTQYELREIDRKLAMLINLVAYQLVEGKTLSESVAVLSRLGLKPSEIAAIYGTTAKSVSVRLAESRRKHIQKE